MGQISLLLYTLRKRPTCNIGYYDKLFQEILRYTNCYNVYSIWIVESNNSTQRWQDIVICWVISYQRFLQHVILHFLSQPYYVYMWWVVVWLGPNDQRSTQDKFESGMTPNENMVHV